MKVAIVNTYDTTGGAARAAYRLHQGLCQSGVDSQMWVQHKAGDDPKVRKVDEGWSSRANLMRPLLDSVAKRPYRQREPSSFSTQWLPTRLGQLVREFNPALINLHWIADGFVPVEAIAQFKRPIVWTLHDLWPATGGCHFSGGCERYAERCGRCPVLHSRREWDLSRLTWLRKRHGWKEVPLTLVAPSQWLAQCARRSSLFGEQRVECIPYGLDTTVFQPIERSQARRLLGLPMERRLVLFCAHGGMADPRKGADLLVAALERLSTQEPTLDMELVVLGASQGQAVLPSRLPTRFLGPLRDDLTLALAYSAADVTVAPSREDNLPNTVLEALACGTPCVAFSIGGMPDLIVPGKNGYLAAPLDPEELARGIGWVLQDESRRRELSGLARSDAVSRFALARQATAYQTLYEELIARG